VTRTAWYMGHSEDDVGDRAILVGDPDRIDRIAPRLQNARLLPVSRGLRTVTGTYGGARVTVAAFGMGAPIATIVLHELAHLGVTRFVRIGTAMHFAPAAPGDFLVSTAAVAYDGTSLSYADGDPSIPQADPDLVIALRSAVEERDAAVHSGTYATFDAFYRDMFGLDEAGRRRATEVRARMQKLGILATDMETAALLTAARALKVSCATLCLGTVDGLTQEKLGAEPLARGEALLFDAALAAIAA
jgi:uridine phosphorylase